MIKDTTEKKNLNLGHSGGKLEKEDTIWFTVLGDPIPKARPRTVRSIDKHGKIRVHTYTPDKTREHEENIAGVYTTLYGDRKFARGVPLLVSIDFFMPIPKNTSKKTRQKMLAGEVRPAKKPDVDNLLKCAMDAVNGVVYEDDSQIVEITGRKFYSDVPRTVIYVAEIADEE